MARRNGEFQPVPKKPKAMSDQRRAKRKLWQKKDKQRKRAKKAEMRKLEASAVEAQQEQEYSMKDEQSRLRGTSKNYQNSLAIGVLAWSLSILRTSCFAGAGVSAHAREDTEVPSSTGKKATTFTHHFTRTIQGNSGLVLYQASRVAS